MHADELAMNANPKKINAAGKVANEIGDEGVWPFAQSTFDEHGQAGEFCAGHQCSEPSNQSGIIFKPVPCCL